MELRPPTQLGIASEAAPGSGPAHLSGDELECASPPQEAAHSARCESYLDRLPLAAESRPQLLPPEYVGARARMAGLHRALAGYTAAPNNPASASIHRRLELAYGPLETDAGPLIKRDRQGWRRLVATPPLNRKSMAPETWPLNPALRLFRTIKNRVVSGNRSGEERSPSDSPDPRGRWHSAGTFRRIMLLTLVLLQTCIAIDFMVAVLPYHGRQPLEIAILALFAVLFCWVSAGFWTAMMGFLMVLRGGDRYAISRTAPADAPLDERTRTAIVMPVCNENVSRVYAGLRATYESLRRTGELAQFDFFVLSDSSDPDTRVAEIQGWFDLCQSVGGFGRVYYRWRKCRIKRKSGNVADFCRRWGANYRYMVVLDADSVMSGECLSRLVRLMEASPNAGIIQTAPRAVGRDTLYGRMQQFATRVYGPLFTAGLHFWQLGESHYWGHNAIIRVAPFMRHCGLGRLPGRGALSGDILSHDFVEAALMRRAGWAVWIAYDLEGSYEEIPPNLVDELQRDRRWCRGNLINSRLFLAEGLHPAQRAVFFTGVMAYLSAPLWFLFLLLSTALLAEHTLVPPKYFVQPYQLFPLWPEWRPELAISLFGATASVLFVPKILSVLLVWAQGAGDFGGRMRVALSALGEVVLSALLAPIRMLFHTQFVMAALTRWGGLHWMSPPRENAETTWTEALRRHGLHTALGVIWAGGVYWLNPTFLWWLAPIVGALMVSIPISVYTSRVAAGERLRAARLFLIPEESRPPPELRVAARASRRVSAVRGFVEAVTDPVVNAVVCASSRARTPDSALARRRRQSMVREALVQGPHQLTTLQKHALLNDPVALSELHLAVWAAGEAHTQWLGVHAPSAGTDEVIRVRPEAKTHWPSGYSAPVLSGFSAPD